MYHNEMNGEKAEDLKKLLYWVKSVKNKMIINYIKTGLTAKTGCTVNSPYRSSTRQHGQVN